MKLRHSSHFMMIMVGTLTLVDSQNVTDVSIENSSVLNSAISDSKDTYNYIVKLQFYVNEEKIPEYVVQLIYSNSSKGNITVKDVFSLYGIHNVTLSQTEDILQDLNIQTSNILSMNGLDTFMKELDIQFRNFYNNILLNSLNVSGLPLKNFLIALGIDNSEFTDGMAYGVPDPYETFKKGNFSQASLENALKIINKTTNELFIACRDEIFAQALNLDTKNATEILEKYNFDSKKAVGLWTYMNITIDQLKNIEVFNNSLNDLRNEQRTKKFLGIVTDGTHIATNKIVYDDWQQNGFSKMYAELAGTVKQVIDGSSIFITSNIISLELNGSLNTSFPILETDFDDMVDCIFVTPLNDTFLLESVEEVVAHQEYIDVRLQLNRTNIVIGSPLVCRGKVYGLAANFVDTNHIRFDSFYKYPLVSSAFEVIFNIYLLVMSILLCYCR